MVDALTTKADPLIRIDHVKHHSLEYTLTLYDDGFVKCSSDTTTQYLKSEKSLRMKYWIQLNKIWRYYH